MKLTASEFINEAENLKSSEMSVRQRLEIIQSQRQRIQDTIITQKYRLEALHMELQSLESSDFADEEDSYDNSDEIAEIMAEISSIQEEIQKYSQQDAELHIEQVNADVELREIETEEQSILSEIQDSAIRTNQNIAFISSFGGDYANVSSQASSSFQYNLAQLSQAAQILGGNVSTGGSTGGRSTSINKNPVSVSSNERTGIAGSGRNFYEAASIQRNTTSSGVMGKKSSGSLHVRQDNANPSTPHDNHLKSDTPKSKGSGLGQKSNATGEKIASPKDISQENTVEIDSKTGTITSNAKLHITPSNHKNMPKRTDAYLPDDERGHIIASSHGGSNHKNNIVPQHRDLNRGSYRHIEIAETEIMRMGGKVQSEKIAYMGQSSTERPEAMIINDEVTYADGKTQSIHHSLTNLSYETQEALNNEVASIVWDDPNPADDLGSEEKELSALNADYSENLKEDYSEADYSGPPPSSSSNKSPSSKTDKPDTTKTSSTDKSTSSTNGDSSKSSSDSDEDK